MFRLLDKNGSITIDGFLTFELDGVAYEIRGTDEAPIIVTVSTFDSGGTTKTVSIYFDKDLVNMSYVRGLVGLGLSDPEIVHISGKHASEMRTLAEKAIHDWAQYLINQCITQGVKK